MLEAREVVVGVQFPEVGIPSGCATLSFRFSWKNTKRFQSLRLRSLELSAIASGGIDRDFLRASYTPGFPTLNAFFSIAKMHHQGGECKGNGVIDSKASDSNHWRGRTLLSRLLPSDFSLFYSKFPWIRISFTEYLPFYIADSYKTVFFVDGFN